MKRAPNLRQIEALKAVIECGTVSRAAEVLHISQPAVSKLLAHLEEDTELELFDRIKGRLIPSEHGMRLYKEIDRVFAGIKQIERAVDLIRREELGQISVGVMPALSGLFISDTNKRFLAGHGDAYISVVIRSSQFIVEWLLSKQVDIGLINRNTDNPYIECVPLRGGDLVCIAPRDHRFAAKAEIVPSDIHGEPYIGFAADNRIRQKIESTLDSYGTRLNYIMDATLAPAVCEMVANGLGIAIVDPVFAFGQRDRLTIRPFLPSIASDLSLCWLRDTRNRHLVDAYVEATRATVQDMRQAMDTN
ncbi:LysR substrate-binding domain-containing protein [Ensifer adhaerens]|uniref:LysR substrate-binding domain-containing protein n=1 Tax=Ensifer adhaerens TaxID=106592 RepID=UPI000CF1352A|nr:LysR substrate-binding domain-containing protein [Ensifer adhaerens]